MVSSRCKMIVKKELETLGLHHAVVELGMVEIFDDVSPQQYSMLNERLIRSGLELLDDKKSILIEKIKTVIMEMVYNSDDLPKLNISHHLSEKLHYDYTYLSNFFSEVTSVTIQQYAIYFKIERVKEFLLYDEINLSQIAAKLDYSSAAHLSTQFKKATGLSPSYYKQLQLKRKAFKENN